MIRLVDLTASQRAAICNGCGSKGGPFAWLKPPKLCFTDACDQHDLAYWVGGDAGAKARADLDLWIGCSEALEAWEAEKPRGRIGVALRWVAAWVFWQAVRLGGRWSFHYGRPRTDADLALIGHREVTA